MSNSNPDRETIAAAAARWVTRRDAGLSPVEQAEFMRWRAADPRHESALEHYSATWSALDRTGQAQAIVQELQRRVRRRRRRMAVAASIALIGASAFWQLRPPFDGPPVASVRPGGVLRAPEKRILPDGSIVELKSGTEIAVDFSATLRRVTLLRGEAHFHVEKNKEWPFAVDIGGMQVRAVGTAFSVQRDAGQIEVVVTEGRIAVEKSAVVHALPARAETETARPSEEPQTLATADAGQRVVVPADWAAQGMPAVVTVSAVELAERLSWRAPRVEFSATPLAEAVAMMNHSAGTGGLRLVVDPASTALAREPISGVFRADNAETFVRMLQLSLGVQADRRGDRIVLRKAP